MRLCLIKTNTNWVSAPSIDISTLARTYSYTHTRTLSNVKMVSLFSANCVTKSHTDFVRFYSSPSSTINHYHSFHTNRAYINRACIDFVRVRHAIVHCVFAGQMTYAAVDALTSPIGSNEWTFPLREIYLQIQNVSIVFHEKRSHLVYFSECLIWFRIDI